MESHAPLHIPGVELTISGKSCSEILFQQSVNCGTELLRHCTSIAVHDWLQYHCSSNLTCIHRSKSIQAPACATRLTQWCTPASFYRTGTTHYTNISKYAASVSYQWPLPIFHTAWQDQSHQPALEQREAWGCCRCWRQESCTSWLCTKLQLKPGPLHKSCKNDWSLCTGGRNNLLQPWWSKA